MKSPERAFESMSLTPLEERVSDTANTASRSTRPFVIAAAWSMAIALLMSPSAAMAIPSAAPWSSSTPSASATSAMRFERSVRGIGTNLTTPHLDLTGSMIMDWWLQARMNMQLRE